MDKPVELLATVEYQDVVQNINSDREFTIYIVHSYK